MNKWIVIIADVDVGAPTPGSGMYETLIMAGGILVATLIGGLWAIYYSKKKKKTTRPRKPGVSKDRPLVFRDANEEPPPEERERRRYRKQRRPHRPMNPTLAQTGGLPPMRDKDTPLPPMP